MKREELQQVGINWFLCSFIPSFDKMSPRPCSRRGTMETRKTELPAVLSLELGGAVSAWHPMKPDPVHRVVNLGRSWQQPDRGLRAAFADSSIHFSLLFNVTFKRL